MRYGIAILILMTATLFAFGNDEIPNLQKPKYQVYTAGQPTPEGFHQASAMGVKTIINVLPEKECMKGENQVVIEEGMNYTVLPFETTNFKMETVRQFSDILNRAEQPVLIHCSTGNHVGGLWFAYRVLIEKAPLGVALKEARKIGLKQELEDSLFNWVVNEKENMIGGEKSGS